MTAARCPAGHDSASVDYCDVCGAPIEAGEVAEPEPQSKDCPNCGAANVLDAFFCERCGYDYTTGQRPSPPHEVPSTGAAFPIVPEAPSSVAATPATRVESVVEIWVDPDWYARNRDETTGPCPPAGLPTVVPLAGSSALIGRPSTSRRVRPQVDCSPDTGVSRRHAQLLLDRDRWFVEDLGSTNGTFVAVAGALPSAPIPSGERRELGDNDRVYVGAWTRLVVRRATPRELRGGE